MTYLGLNLKHMRNLLGRSQEEMASVFGIKRSSYASYEQGHAEPSLKLLSKMCDHYQISMDVMLNVLLIDQGEAVISAMKYSYRNRTYKDLEHRSEPIIATQPEH